MATDEGIRNLPTSNSGWNLKDSLELMDDRLMMIDQFGARVQANLSEDTRWIGETPGPGDYVIVYFDGARTRGIPAQIWAQAVACSWLEGTAAAGPALETADAAYALDLARLDGAWPEGIAEGDAVRVYFPVEGGTLDVIGVVKK